MDPKLDALAEVVGQNQAEMRRQSWVAQQLREPATAAKGNMSLKRKLAVALTALVLIAFGAAKVVEAVACTGGGSGWVQRVM